METPQDIDLILRILSGEDELAYNAELEKFKSDPASQKQLQYWRSVLGEAASLLDETQTWEEMPAKQKDQIMQRALQSFRETVITEDTKGEDVVLVDEILLVDESHKVVPTELREAVTPENTFGWLVVANNLAPGMWRVLVVEQGKGRLRPTQIAEFSIPTVSSAAIASEALAGQSLPEKIGEDLRSAYDTFKSTWNTAGLDYHLQGDIEGYIVPQQQGLRVVAFVPKLLSHETKD